MARPRLGPTLAALPTAAIPCGRGPTGLPFGLQVCGPRGADAFVLAAASAVERALGEHPQTARPLPDLKALAAAGEEPRRQGAG